MKQTTRTHILKAALELAAKEGYRNLTREAIAVKADVTPSLISYHLGTMVEMRRHLIREAIRTENLPVLAQAVAMRDKHALKATPELRTAALDSLRK